MFEIDNVPYGIAMCLCVVAVLAFARSSPERFLGVAVVTCVLGIALVVGYHVFKSSRGFAVGTSWRAAISILLLGLPSVTAIAGGRAVVRRNKLLAVITIVVVYVVALMGSTVLAVQSNILR